jgi:3-oxoadipate enol-lactonase
LDRFPPDLPEGRALDLTGRGTTFVRDTGGDGPTLLLLHGWTASSALNWFACFGPLSEAGFRVVALDHRGHGHGIRSARKFRLDDCADDAVAVLDVLGIDAVVPVGYSMGGPVAQLVWRRHRSRVEGLILCATAARFRDRRADRLVGGVMGSMSLAARLAPSPVRDRVRERVLVSKYDDTPLGLWAREQARLNHLRSIVDAAHELARYDATPWIGEVDVPTAVVMPTRDETVRPADQRRLASSIDGVRLIEVDARHDMCATRPDRFVTALLSAVDDVWGRVRSR